MVCIDIKADHGALFDGFTDDTVAWKSAVADWKATGREIVCPVGRSVVSDTILFDNIGTKQFSQGPRIHAPGPLSSYLIGKGMSNKPVIKIDGRNPSVTAHPTYFGATRIEGLGIEQEDCTNCDGLDYQSTWHTTFEEIHMRGLSGRGYFARNPQYGVGSEVGDNNASAHVDILQSRVTDCAGPAWSSAGSYGGVTNHALKQFYSMNNAHSFGEGQIDNDGALHFEMANCYVGAFNNVNRPLVKLRSSHVIPDQVVIKGGEYGNGGGTHFDVDTVTGFNVMSIRQVRRFGETAARYGFLLRNATGLIRNFNFLDILLNVDNVAYDSAPFTWMKKTGPSPLEAVHFGYSPALNNAPGVVPYEGF